MTEQDRKQYNEKHIDYASTINEIISDMGEYVKRCDQAGESMLSLQFSAAKKLLEKAVEGMDLIRERTDTEYAEGSKLA